MEEMDHHFLTDDGIKHHLAKMLKDVDDFCRLNNITYFLAWGTLIGAVRHHGFIPWDDDIDIWMPRPDYDRFISLFNHPVYTFQCMETDCLFPLCFGKICDLNYSAVDELGKDFGLFIDVFPLDGLPKSSSQISKHIRRIRRVEKVWSNQVLSSKRPLSSDNSFGKNLKIIVGKVLHLFIPVSYIVRTYLRVSKLFDYYSSERVIDLSTNIIFDKRDFSSSIRGLFEGTVFPIPVGYDSLLRSYYGDYMKLPKEEERYSHGIKAYLKV